MPCVCALTGSSAKSVRPSKVSKLHGSCAPQGPGARDHGVTFVLHGTKGRNLHAQLNKRPFYFSAPLKHHQLVHLKTEMQRLFGWVEANSLSLCLYSGGPHTSQLAFRGLQAVCGRQGPGLLSQWGGVFHHRNCGWSSQALQVSLRGELPSPIS